MNRERPQHPFQLAIEQAWDEGHTPRILVLGDRVEGGLPKGVIAAHDGRPIALDLDPSYPLQPRFYATRVELVLSFNGFATQCSIPWHAVVLVEDTTTGFGFVRLVPRARQAPELAPEPPRALAAVSNMPARGAMPVAEAKPGVSNMPREPRPWAPRVLRGGKADEPSGGSSGGSDG